MSVVKLSSRSSSPHPQSRTMRSLQASVILMLALALGACSVIRLAYNQADLFVYWQLNKAFDFNDTQSARTKAAIKQWFQWHRRTQLPLYAQFASRAQKEALGPVTPALACERRVELEGWSRKAVDQAVPMMADIVLSLSPEQVKHLQEHQEKTNDDFKDDYLQDDPKDRSKAATKFVLKYAELFYGRLDSDQRDQLRHDIAALPLNAQQVYDERVLYQRLFVQMIRQLHAQHATPAQAQQALRELFQQFFDPTQEPQRSQRVQWINSGCLLTSNLHTRTTLEQHKKAAQRLREWEADFRLLTTQTK
ncbi:MAG: hypothetical protein EOP38_03310 [Rubrivivax sp.]|nr:MAG: hypothetical protein EOP38_03310 [Rubrivivax sp.]